MTSSPSPGRRPQAPSPGPAQSTHSAATSVHATAHPLASQGAWAVRLGLRVLTAGALAVSAYLHVDLAQGYRLIGEQVTMGDLFLAQAAVAGLAALTLLVRPARLTWAFAALVGFGSLAALVLTVYVAVPAIGPFPRIYEAAWFFEKTASAVAAALAAAAATAGLLTDHAARRAQLPTGRPRT
jgi:hypothetical protein